MPTPLHVPPRCLRIAWQDPAQTPHQLAAAARLLTCGASRRPEGMTDLLLEGPQGALRLEPVQWSRRCWHAAIELPWPRGADTALSARVLLAANQALVMHMPMTFAMDDQSALLLVGRVHAYPGQDDDWALARQLGLLLQVCVAVHALAGLEDDTPVAFDALPGFIAPREDCERDDSRDAGDDDLSLLELLAAAGLPSEQVCYAAASGRLPLSNGDVHIEHAGSARALLFSAELGHGVLDGQAVHVLRANADLMRQHGLAFVHSRSGHRLVAHWPRCERPPGEFDDMLAALDVLPASLDEVRTVRDPVDTDFSGLMLT